MKPIIDWATNFAIWFQDTSFYDYWNWLLAQPTDASFGVILVAGVLVIVIIVVVALR